PLPFVSVGGSSLIANLAAMGVLLAIHARGRGSPAPRRREGCRGCRSLSLPSDGWLTRLRPRGNVSTCSQSAGRPSSLQCCGNSSSAAVRIQLLCGSAVQREQTSTCTFL